MNDAASELELSSERARAQASALDRGALSFLWASVLGLAGVLAVSFYLWRDYRLGWDAHPVWWEPVVAGLVGGFIGFGLAVPFVIWFRMQATLVHVQLSMEEHTRLAEATARETARSIQELADAGMSGEWGFGAMSGPSPTVDPAESD